MVYTLYECAKCVRARIEYVVNSNITAELIICLASTINKKNSSFVYYITFRVASSDDDICKAHTALIQMYNKSPVLDCLSESIQEILSKVYDFSVWPLSISTHVLCYTRNTK